MEAPHRYAHLSDTVSASDEPEAARQKPGRLDIPPKRCVLRWIHTPAQRVAVVAFRERRYREILDLDDACCLPCDHFDETGLISAWADGRVVGCVTTNQMRIREFPERSIYRRFIPISVARRLAAIARPEETIREFARLTGSPGRPGSTAAILRHLLRQSHATFMLTAALTPERLESYARLGRAVGYMPLGGSFHGAEEFHGLPLLFQILYRSRVTPRRIHKVSA